MIARIILGLGLAFAMLNGVTAAPPAGGKDSQKFVTSAIEGNYAEVALGKLVQDKSMNEDVRSFGQMLVTDHSAGNEKAIALANSLGIEPPSGPSKKQQTMYNRLSKLSGKAFDREFVRMMVDDHQRDIKEFDKMAKSSNDQIAGFAKDTLPTLHKHLDAAQSLARSKNASR